MDLILLVSNNMDSEHRAVIGRIAPIAILVVVVGASVGYAWSHNGGSLDFSDTDFKIVVTGSMDGEPRDQYDIPTIPVGSLVFIQRVPTGDASGEFYSSLEVGDVLTFDYTHPVSREDMVVTHRIIAIDEADGVYTYTLKGDSIADDPTNGSVQVVTSLSGDVIGKVTGVSPWLGKAVVFLSTWTGKFCLIVVPCLVLVASEMLNIVRILRSGRDGEDGCEIEAEGVPSVADGTEDVAFTDSVEVREVPDDGLFRRSI